MPEPVLVSIAAALAAKAAVSLYDLVKRQFGNRSEADAALAAAQGAAPDSPEVHALAAELKKAEEADPRFADALRTQWQTVSHTQQHADRGGVTNQISGNVGKAVQARDIEGGVSF